MISKTQIDGMDTLEGGSERGREQEREGGKEGWVKERKKEETRAECVYSKHSALILQI